MSQGIDIPPMVHVVWRDASLLNGRVTDDQERVPGTLQVVGFIRNETPTAIEVAFVRDATSKSYTDVLTIQRNVILAMRRLRAR